jgi:hypothetical protein
MKGFLCFIGAVAALIILGIAALVVAFAHYNTQSCTIESPAGLGKIRFTRSGCGMDGWARLRIEAKRKGHWSWELVDDFNISDAGPVHFEEARWACDGAVLLICSNHGADVAHELVWSKESESLVPKEIPAWSRKTYTHALDLRTGECIALTGCTAKSIDRISDRIAALVGANPKTQRIVVDFD